MRADDARRWVAARCEAERREGQAKPEAPPDPAVSWARALSLMALLERMIGWPIEPDAIRRREDEAAADAWMRLRAAYRRRA
jgi:hypothetical protein